MRTWNDDKLIILHVGTYGSGTTLLEYKRYMLKEYFSLEKIFERRMGGIGGK